MKVISVAKLVNHKTDTQTFQSARIKLFVALRRILISSLPASVLDDRYQSLQFNTWMSYDWHTEISVSYRCLALWLWSWHVEIS